MPRVLVDMNLCQSHGECVYVAGHLRARRRRRPALAEEIDPADVEVAREAADACPMLAIRVEA